MTGARAAEILRVNRVRIGQLAENDKVPYETHSDGTRLYRREQLTIVAQPRGARCGNRGFTVLIGPSPGPPPARSALGSREG